MKSRVLKPCAMVAFLALGACSNGAPAGDARGGGDADHPQAEAAREGGIITALSVSREDGKAVDRYMTYHPLEVRMSLRPTAPAADHVIHVGLVEKGKKGAARDTLRTCYLGAFDATYGVSEGKEAQEIKLSHDFVVPKDCLAGGADQGTFNLWVGIGAPGAGAGGDSLGTQFFNEDRIDLGGLARNDACLGPDGKSGCVIDVPVTASEGENISLDSLKPASHVAVLSPRCGVDFAAPLAAVNGQMRLFGAAAHSGVKGNEEAINALMTARGSVEPVEVSYSLCPRGDDGSCASGTGYAPLAVGAQGPNQKLAASARIDRLVNAEPSLFHHSVFVAPESEACQRLTGDEAGSWSQYATYNLRVCEKAPFAERRNGGDEASDDCHVEPIKLVIARPAHSADASSWQLYKDYSSSVGNSVVNVNASFGTDNNLTLSGATSHNWANANVGGWFGFDLFNLWADAAAYVSLVGSNADAGVQVFGQTLYHYHNEVSDIHYQFKPMFSQEACAYYNYGVAGLGLNIEACAKGTAGLDTSLDVVAQTGSAGAPFDTSTRVGHATVKAGPFADLQLTASAWADIGVADGGVSGSLTLLDVTMPATGDLKWGLVNANPAGLVVTANARLDMYLSTMAGNIHGWAEVATPDWCSCGDVCPGYPCVSWSTVWDEDLVSWDGWSWNWNLYQAGGQMSLGNAPPPPASCSHTPDTAGDPLIFGCSSCATSVCSSDPFCCTDYWDEVCASEAADYPACQ